MGPYEIKGPISDDSLNKTNQMFIELYTMRNVLQTQINDLVLWSGDGTPEIIQARGGHQVLADRLNSVDMELTQKATRDEVVNGLDEKVDKIALSQSLNTKRDKDVEIEMADLSQKVREAMTGGSVAVVGEDAVGSINLKNDAVTTGKLHKNAGIKFPYFSNSTFDLDYFWEGKTVIASGDVKNNPFEAGCQVINFRSRTTDNITSGIAWITQIAVVYDSASDMDFGSAMYRHLRVSEADSEVTIKSEWKPLGISKITSDMLTDDFAVREYLADDTFDLNDALGQGNYMSNADVQNNPYGMGCSVSVDRFKTELNSNLVTIVQRAVCYSTAFDGKYLGREAVRVLRAREQNNEIETISDWSDGIEEPIKILTIGNSYGLNATEYIHRICESVNVNVKVGCLYISGGLLSDHSDNISNNTKAYRFYRRYHVDGEITDDYLSDYSVDDGLDAEEWDYVFFNQASSQSGVYDTFQPYLNDILSHVKNKLPNTKISLMPTWAYSSDFDDTRFDKYDRNQLTMYNDILDAYKQAMSNVDFDIVIPVGTAIQNARTDDYLMNIDREITRDGYHLGDTGMYIAGLTFFKTFFKNENIDWKPSTVDKRAAYFANVAVNNAIINPFKLTDI